MLFHSTDFWFEKEKSPSRNQENRLRFYSDDSLSLCECEVKSFVLSKIIECCK